MMVTDEELNWPMRPDILFYELSIFGNPIIYTIVNERFKVFLKNQLYSILRPGHQPTTQFFTTNSNSQTDIQTPVRKHTNNKTLKGLKENKVSDKTITVKPIVDQSFLNTLRQNEKIQHTTTDKAFEVNCKT